MAKRTRRVAATDLRVHLGEALRSLEDGDIIIEKGGVPVAVLSRYVPAADADDRAAAYERGLSHRGDRSPEALARARAAIARGWSGIDAKQLISDIYRWREEGASYRYADLEKGRMVADAPAGQRRVYRPSGRKGRTTR